MLCIKAKKPAAKTAEANQEAKANNMTSQMHNKAAQGIYTSAFKLGEVHLSNIRSAQKLWFIFPYCTSSD